VKRAHLYARKRISHAYSDDPEASRFQGDVWAQMASFGPRQHLVLDKSKVFTYSFLATMVDQSLYDVDKVRLSVAKESTGEDVPRSESNGAQDDMDLAALGKRPQLRVEYFTS